ncbi:transmembrane protein 268-like isoform X2 [Brienomyrus brachyistius]|uniref:transmembrane protein 268-like isoform X2 n=1 Tax=Brienomyrus brachyistius TaxID=42636 RepID=UPI0020B426F7|nr:transmembrane protein 268-like isoform X2 [Brienomyrus brachyistius]
MEDGITAASDAQECEVHIAPPRLHFSKKCGEAPQWTNGQCVIAVPSCPKLCRKFDIPHCRALLEQRGFNIPAQDFDRPLQVALGSSSVRRYLLFSSSVFQFVFALININTDVRLVQVNERLWKYRLLVGLDDSESLCMGTLRLYFLFWDLSPCLTRLTGSLEQMKLMGGDLQKRLKRSMSHLHLPITVSSHDIAHGDPDEERSEETRPLLAENEGRGRNTANSQREAAFTKSYSLVPDQTLSSQITAYRLLMTYSATYVKLSASQRLPNSPASSLHALNSDRPHCTMAPVCLCQYIKKNVLY